MMLADLIALLLLLLRTLWQLRVVRKCE